MFKGIEGNVFETRNDSSMDLKLDYIDSDRQLLQP